MTLKNCSKIPILHANKSHFCFIIPKLSQGLTIIKKQFRKKFSFSLYLSLVTRGAGGVEISAQLGNLRLKIRFVLDASIELEK
jgi:hypothetical protein